MIKSITVTNHQGETINIDLRKPWETGLAVANIDGLYPPKAHINSTELSSTDGSVFNSARVTERNITAQFVLFDKNTIEQARHILYKYFPIKRPIRLEIHTDERDAYTIGYVESNIVGIFSNMESASVSLICPDPYFYSVDDVLTPLNDPIGGFEFPFENPLGTASLTFSELSASGPVDIVYEGDTPVGVDIDIHAIGPVGNIRLYSMRTEQEMIIDASKIAAKTGSGISSGDNIHICTVTGKKSITLTRSGVTYNILSCLSRETGWIQLEKGDNIIVYSATGIQNAQIYVTNKMIYEGI